MKRNDFLQSMREEGRDIEIPEFSEELKSCPISAVPDECIPVKRKKRIKPIPILCLAFVLCIGMSVFNSIMMKKETTVTIDINPSIELTLNSYDRVIGAKAYNDEGEEFLSELNLTFCTLDAAVNSIIILAYQKGYLTDDKTHSVLYSIKSLNSQKEHDFYAFLESNLRFRQIDPRHVEPTANDELFARLKHVSPAKLAFLRELYRQKYGKDIEFDQVTEDMLNRSVTEMVESYS